MSQSGHTTTAPPMSKGPGDSHVGPAGIIVTAVYLLLVAVSLFYCLIKVWPYPTPSTTPKTAQSAGPAATPTPPPAAQPADVGGAAGGGPSQVQSRGLPEPSPVVIFGQTFLLWDEVRLLLIVLLTGALGGLVHALRSVYWYVGNRALKRSWLLMYITLPFVGASLALVFYFVIRGGFFSPQSSFEQTSPFGFAAFSALIGMFSTQAVMKLQHVAETLLVKPDKGVDAKPQETSAQLMSLAVGALPAPVVVAVQPDAVTAGRPTTIMVTGNNFSEKSVVRIDGVDQETLFRDATSLQASVTAAGSPPGEQLQLTVFNPPPGGGLSNAFTLKVGE